MDTAREVKAAADIVSVVGAHVRLRRQSGGRFLGLCPFHSEKTPSFSVHSGLQIYKCFGCGKSGDVFSFLMELQGLTFFEALTTLAEQHGIEVRRAGKQAGADPAARKRESLLQLHDLAQEFYVGELRSQRGSAARGYLRDRGLGDAEIKEFGLGYAPAGNALLRKIRNRGFKRGEVRDSGLVGEAERDRSPYDRFRDRLTFPIHSEFGKVIGFGGRALRSDKQPKYLNSPETPVYRKATVLYNLHRARTAVRQAGCVVLVEGYMDVIGVWRAGVHHVVATCGTALTPQQIGVLRRHCDTVVVNFDSDEAGQAAAERSVELLLREGVNVRVLELPGGLDPDEYCKAHGGDGYRRELDKAPRYFQWLLDRSRRKFDLATSEGRTAAFEQLLPTVTLLPDAVQRATTVTELAEHIGLQSGIALRRLQQAAGKAEPARGPETPQAEGLAHAERLIVALLATDAQARADLLEEAHGVASEGLASVRILAAMQAVEASGDGYDHSAVEARLESADRARLAALVFDNDRPVTTVEEGREALSALRRKVNQDRYREVLREMKIAVRSNDAERMAPLLERKAALEAELGLAPRRGG